VNFYVLNYTFILLHELTLFVCVWQWSCNSLHESRHGFRWSWWRLKPERGQLGKFYKLYLAIL